MTPVGSVLAAAGGGKVWVRTGGKGVGFAQRTGTQGLAAGPIRAVLGIGRSHLRIEEIGFDGVAGFLGLAGLFPRLGGVSGGAHGE